MSGTHSHVRLVNHKVSQNLRSARYHCNVLAGTLYRRQFRLILCNLHVQQAHIHSLKHDCHVATLGIQVRMINAFYGSNS